jgi:hypothetical protein
MPVSRGEQLCKHLLDTYLSFLRHHDNLRPDWLRNPKTGRRLEIDRYYPEIRVGIEYNGVQHGRPILGLQRDHAAFMEQQIRDAFKTQTCKERGIELIAITIFDLTEFRFGTLMRRIFQAANRATMDNPTLAWKVKQARQRFERGEDYPALRPLFHEAERLSRQRVRPGKPKTVSWWRQIFG